ncbi:hypothetical protein [Gottfriedia luciferensis]|uniref:hypothetical protein n=1 Tax=Gottfriedia luciferensis TaxID=178774 RepID=UPI000B42D23E|nr:hypothetical protein [Gottfriedia luciferensis]
MKFNFIDQFLEERENRQAKHQELIDQEEKVLSDLKAAKREFEICMMSSIENGKDATEELDKLEIKIEEAKKSYERCKKATEVFSALSTEKITANDVLVEFNEIFYPKYNEEIFQPVLKKIEQCKKDYFAALEEYQGVIKDFEWELNKCQRNLSSFYYYKLNRLENELNVQKAEKIFIQQGEVR